MRLENQGHMQGKGISWFGRTLFSVTEILNLPCSPLELWKSIHEGFSGPDIEKVVAPTVLEDSTTWWA